MSTFRIFTLFFFISLFNTPLSFSADPPQISDPPSPPPADAPVPAPSNSSVPSPQPTPSPSPNLNSPPAPPPADSAPESSPSPAPAPGTNSTHTKEKSPEPAPSDATDTSHEGSGDLESPDESNSSGGMSRRKKAGIAIGVIASVSVVGIGALVYRKRQQNIRRSQFGYAARREIL
ncbi:hypothetical protein ACH5RR_009898 [Cinchona calisaya]|uniref:Uncharacterized protein n=1 Tax=Cinchona calisaya TaxID=153742 RepID=A0ABD3AHF6_9GENT